MRVNDKKGASDQHPVDEWPDHRSRGPLCLVSGLLLLWARLDMTHYPTTIRPRTMKRRTPQISNGASFRHSDQRNFSFGNKKPREECVCHTLCRVVQRARPQSKAVAGAPNTQHAVQHSRLKTLTDKLIAVS